MFLLFSPSKFKTIFACRDGILLFTMSEKTTCQKVLIKILTNCFEFSKRVLHRLQLFTHKMCCDLEHKNELLAIRPMEPMTQLYKYVISVTVFNHINFN